MRGARLGRAVCIALSLVCFITSTSSLPAAAQQEEYEGRPIAPVMSYRGAPWLERPERAEEEDPAALLELLPVEAGDTVVDLGCGSGYHARRLARLVGDDGRVLCVDIQPEMLEIAQRTAEQAGVSNIDYVLSQADDPKLPSATVDLILLVDVYHELSAPEPMLAAMRRSLAPGGVVALVEYRLEGDTASWIQVAHRMSVDQVLREWLPAGFRLRKLHESLPSQHLFLFEVSPPE